MSIHLAMEVNNGDTLGALRGFLKMLFAQKIVDAMLVPLESSNAEQITPTVVRDCRRLDFTNPLAPVMRVNAATLIARLQRQATRESMGVVLHPCELRAVIEMAKVGGIDLHRLVLIGIDCMGTYEPDIYAQIARASDTMTHWTRQGPIAPYRLRNACTICEYFVPENVDISIGLIGLNVRERLLVEIREDWAERLPLKPLEVEGRGKAIARLAAARHYHREKALANASQLIDGVPSFIGLIASCNTCGECLEVCPLCDTDAFTPKSARALRTHRPNTFSGRNISARKREAVMWTQLVEWGRRAVSCVGCGMCESVCPTHIPLTSIYGVVGRKVQESFHYVPGSKVDEKLPWAMAG